MNRNRTFKKTRLPDMRKSLEAAYGHDKGCAIFADAENILDAELSTVDDRGNKMVGKHIRRNILPGYASYSAMLDMGISSTEAVNFVKIELCRSVERMASL